MNKEFTKIVLRRFVKGFLAGLGGFALIYLFEALPLFQASLPDIFTDKTLLILATALLLALEKFLQGYRPQ